MHRDENTLRDSAAMTSRRIQCYPTMLFFSELDTNPCSFSHCQWAGRADAAATEFLSRAQLAAITSD